jgi:MFS family permease
VESPADAKSANDAKASLLVDARAASRELPWRFFVVTAVFTLAASGDLFLMRRLTDLKMDVAYVPLAWVSLQLLKGLFNVPGGRASDRFGRRRVLALAWVLYAVTYAGFGFATTWWAAWLLIVPYALHYGLAEGGQRALLTDLVPKPLRGRAFGIQLAIEGLFILPANVGFGFLMDRFGAVPAFVAAGSCAALAAVLLLAIVPQTKPHAT